MKILEIAKELSSMGVLSANLSLSETAFKDIKIETEKYLQESSVATKSIDNISHYMARTSKNSLMMFKAYGVSIALNHYK